MPEKNDIMPGTHSVIIFVINKQSNTCKHEK